MFYRNIIGELEKWAQSPIRKPLILRGARQVGKTTVVKQFARQFDQYIYLNLEKAEDARIFTDFHRIEDILKAIFYLHNQERTGKKTLIFIDEIQEVPKAMEQLRYFYEEAPEIYIIAAGSLLESLLGTPDRYPVGRVEYRILRPVSFEEFLGAAGEIRALEQFNAMPMADFAHEKLLQLFHEYLLIGGMPEVIRQYLATKDLTGLTPIYESLIASYLTDTEKYARNLTLVQVIRHCIQASYLEAGNRVVFQGFGNSNYRSREVGEALRALEKAMLVHLIYPTAHMKIPAMSDHRKSPRLQVLDTGLLNHFAGLQKGLLNISDLNDVYQGKLAEHIVGQELLATSFSVLHALHFWARDKKGASAEVDFVVHEQGRLIPVEVKSGATGKLRSLHQFMETAPVKIAIRLYAGKIHIDKLQTPGGKGYYLLNLPYYLASRISNYIEWISGEIPESMEGSAL